MEDYWMLFSGLYIHMHIHTYTQTLIVIIFKKLIVRGWRVGSKVKNTRCFRRKPVRFPAMTWWLATIYDSSSKGVQNSLLASEDTIGVVHIHACRQNTRTHRMKNHCL